MISWLFIARDYIGAPAAQRKRGFAGGAPAASTARRHQEAGPNSRRRSGAGRSAGGTSDAGQLHWDVAVRRGLATGCAAGAAASWLRAPGGNGAADRSLGSLGTCAFRQGSPQAWSGMRSSESLGSCTVARSPRQHIRSRDQGAALQAQRWYRTGSKSVRQMQISEHIMTTFALARRPQRLRMASSRTLLQSAMSRLCSCHPTNRPS